MIRMVLITIILPFALTANSQQSNLKLEKEERIKIQEVPAPAQDFITSLKMDSKIKWYKEQSLDRTSIEAKTKYKGKRYSIEFSLKGKLEDIEILIDHSSIPESTRNNIQEFLAQEYDKFKWCKGQIQYTGSVQELQKVTQDDFSLPDTQIKYEIIVKTKLNRQKQLIEMLFSAEGLLEQKKQIIFRNIDNLEY